MRAEDGYLICPRDCFDIGWTYGREGRTVDAMFAMILMQDDVTEFTDEQRQSLTEGWHAGRADWEAFERDMEIGADALPVFEDDTKIPF